MTWITRRVWQPWPPTSADPHTFPWYHGIQVRSRRVTVRTSQPLFDVEHVRQKVLRVVADVSEDQRIADIIAAATTMAETETERALAPQTWELILSGFPSGVIVLPRLPFIAIESMTYVDASGAQQSMHGSPAQFLVSDSDPNNRARVESLAGASWPSTESRLDAVTIRYTAGFQDLALPPAPTILEGIRLAVAEIYDTGQCDVEKLRPFWRKVVDD